MSFKATIWINGHVSAYILIIKATFENTIYMSTYNGDAICISICATDHFDNTLVAFQDQLDLYQLWHDLGCQRRQVSAGFSVVRQETGSLTGNRKPQGSEPSKKGNTADGTGST